MTSEEALSAVRRAFSRETWRAVDQMSFICRLHGVTDYRFGRSGRMPRCDEGILPDNRSPVFFDLSNVHRPADRLAFHGYEQPGAVIGHVGGLARVDFG